jgi:Rrf2 family protein
LVRLGEGVEWAIHCCTFLAVLPPGAPLPASRLAEFHGVPPAYLAKHLQALARAGIVVAVPGAKGGYALGRPADEISMLDIVDAVEGAAPAFTCTEIRQRGPAALEATKYGRPCSIARAMWDAEHAWREELRKRTVGEIARGLARDVAPEAAMKTAAWYEEVRR